MKFHVVAQAFEAIEVVSSRIAITEELAHLFKSATPTEAKIIAYLSLGMLRPPYLGMQFNIAKKTMVAVVARLLKQDEEAVAKAAKKEGDLGSLIVQGSWRHQEDLTVTQVYKALCVIEQVSGTGSQEEKIHLLNDLLKSVDPLSAKYIVRVVLGTLRLGFSDMTLVDALSWMEVGDKSLRKDIEHAYNVCADIGLIAQTLKEGGIAAIKDMKIHIGVPIRPAAAERLPTAKAIIDKIGDCIAQPKLDGFRLQIHIDTTGSQPLVKFFSRNLQDMSAMFPDLREACLNLNIKSMICEGEAIAYDEQTGNFLPFQETVKRKRKHGIEKAMEELPLTVFIFDLLYLNGKDLMDDTHAKRRTLLLDAFKHIKSGAVKVIEEKKITTAQELETYFQHNISSGLEGLVVKKSDSTYQPGKRNFNWIKLKRQEEGHLEDTIDCVVLGYYAGFGKRARFGIGAFLIGLYNTTTDQFETVAKIGTGLKDEGWIDLKKKCDAIAVAQKPSNVVCAKELYPDVWVRPEIVCLVRADEITQSPLHAAGKTVDKLGYALRFPRIMGYRPDKNAEQATTVKELISMYKHQFTKK